MKHLKKFNESLDSTKEQILENFLYITDKFGEPTVQSSNYGTHKKWTLSWNINMNFSVMQNAEELIKKLKDITEDIDDVLAATDRLEDFHCNMSISNNLIIELVPKDTGTEDFKFIKGFESRALYVRINEVERFFNSKGLRVIKWDNESSYSEYSETNDLEIVLNKRDNQIMAEFHDLVMAELNLIDDKEYVVRTQGDSIVIYPNEEKSYIEVTTT
jgi:hypothetical protein